MIKPDPEAPDDHQHDPDDHEDASQRDPADAGSSVCPGVHLLLRSSVYWTTGPVQRIPGGGRSHSGSGRSSPGQEPVSLAKEVRVPWSTRPLTRRKIAPSTTSAAISFGQENSRCSGFGGSSSSISPQTCSKIFLPSDPGDQSEDDADRSEDELHRIGSSWFRWSSVPWARRGARAGSPARPAAGLPRSRRCARARRSAGGRRGSPGW